MFRDIWRYLEILLDIGGGMGVEPEWQSTRYFST